MVNLLEILPVDLFGSKVFELLNIKDILLLERACGSKTSHKHFVNMFPYCSPVVLSTEKHDNISSLEWFAKRKCKLHSLTIILRLNNFIFHVKNLQIDHIDLSITSSIDMQDC